jgi:predicted RNA-binding Zn-ribbon protein involved in translation (DUF1610 family)
VYREVRERERDVRACLQCAILHGVVVIVVVAVIFFIVVDVHVPFLPQAHATQHDAVSAQRQTTCGRVTRMTIVDLMWSCPKCGHERVDGHCWGRLYRQFDAFCM